MSERVSDAAARAVFAWGEKGLPPEVVLVDFASDLLDARQRITQLERERDEVRRVLRNLYQGVRNFEKNWLGDADLDAIRRALGEERLGSPLRPSFSEER